MQNKNDRRGRTHDKNPAQGEHGLSDETLKNTIAKPYDEKNRSNAIIQAIGDGIIIQNTEYIITYQNDVHIRLYGNHVGKYCYKVFGNGTICEECPVEMSFMDGEIHKTEKKVVTDKGIFYYEG